MVFYMVDVASKNPSIPAELIGESSKTEPASVVEYFSVEYLERALGSNLWEILTTGISILIILIATIIIA